MEEQIKDKLAVVFHGIIGGMEGRNGLGQSEIINKFKLGLSAINIAPEIANIESEYIINNINDEKKLICGINFV